MMPSSDHMENLRREMVDDQIRRRGVKDEKILEAMEKVPRHLFVEESNLTDAYEDRPLPIGDGQTISQPYIVAYMTERLELTGKEKVLEIGTGSGYQTALLAEFAGSVHTVEIVPRLAERARRVLESLGYVNVRSRVGNGLQGWPEAAPFDRIILTAGVASIPGALREQLAGGGWILGPVGRPYEQILVSLRRVGDEEWETNRLISVLFVSVQGG